MSTNMFESETWALIDQYLAMLQQLSAQSQHISTTQNEVYLKLSDLIYTMRNPPPPVWQRVRPSTTNQSSARGTQSARVHASARRRPRESNDDIERGSPDPGGRTQSRPPHARNQTGPTTWTSTRQTPGEVLLGLRAEQSRTTPSLPDTTSTTTNTSEMEHTIQRPSLFGAFGSTTTTTSTPFTPPAHSFTNFINELQWGQPQTQQQNTPHPHPTWRPFNFMDNVPVFPTSEEVSSATRIIPFGSVDAPNNAQCPITLVPFEASELVMQIVHCGHMFDVVHLNGWFRDNVRCPVCRHDIRETGVGDDTPSALAPDAFVDDGNNTDPDMPELELDNEPIPILGTEPIPSDTPPIPPPTPRHFSNNPSPLFHANIGSLTGIHHIGMSEDTIHVPPVWGFNQTSHEPDDNNTPPLTRIFSEMQSAMATQGLDMISNAISQSIRESFHTTPPNTSANTEDNGDTPEEDATSRNP